MLVEVNVTNEDIAEGIQHSCMSCPLALAISRTIGVRVLVGLWGIATLPDAEKYFGWEDAVSPEMEDHVVQFMSAFDDYEGLGDYYESKQNYDAIVLPFKFWLDVPEWFGR